MSLYEPEAAFAAQPGSLARGFPGIRQSLSAFVEMKGTLDVLKARNACFLIQFFHGLQDVSPRGRAVRQTLP